MAASNSQQVYLLWHTHLLDDGEADEKLLGVYSDEEIANTRKALATTTAGFRDFPEGFTIGKYVVDRDEWKEGFETT